MGRPSLTESEMRAALAEVPGTLLRIEFASPMNTSRVVRRCEKCGNEWGAAYRNVVRAKSGCPRCANVANTRARLYKNLRDRETYVYRINSACGKYAKIGVTQRPEFRIGDVERVTPFKLARSFSIVFEGSKDSAIGTESYLSAAVESAKFSGFEGATEWLVAESLDKIMLDWQSGAI